MGARRAFAELGIERELPSAEEWMFLVGLPLAGAQGLVLWVLAALVACGAALAASTFLGFLGSGRLRPGPESTLSVPTSG